MLLFERTRVLVVCSVRIVHVDMERRLFAYAFRVVLRFPRIIPFAQLRVVEAVDIVEIRILSGVAVLIPPAVVAVIRPTLLKTVDIGADEIVAGVLSSVFMRNDPCIKSEILHSPCP